MSTNLNTLKQDFRFGVISQEEYDRVRTERHDTWRKLSAVEKLADLNRRLGVGIGAKRQRAKLDAIINKPKPVPVPVIVADQPPTQAPKKKFKKGNKK